MCLLKRSRLRKPQISLANWTYNLQACFHCLPQDREQASLLRYKDYTVIMGSGRALTCVLSNDLVSENLCRKLRMKKVSLQCAWGCVASCSKFCWNFYRKIYRRVSSLGQLSECPRAPHLKGTNRVQSLYNTPHYYIQGSYRQVLVKFKHFSRLSYSFQGLKVKILI